MDLDAHLDTAAAYEVLKARDARFDGRLFVGVTSTGVYCRPVCRVRTPMLKNCRFFGTRALAEAAAFRPCLKCRPEIAPGLSMMDSSMALADTAARWMVHAVHAGDSLSVPAIAARLGITDRHLRRIFMAAQGVSPLAYLTTQRLLLAKQLLTDTAMPITQVAMASGFDSLRRFNAAFVEHYRLNPSALRRDGREGTVSGSARTAVGSLEQPLKLAWRPPFDIQAMLGFFDRRAVAGIEVVDMATLSLRRTLRIGHRGNPLAGWLSMRFVPERHELHLHAAPAFAPVLGPLMQRVRQAFDLDAEPSRIDPLLATLPGPAREGLRLPGALDGFEAAVRVVLGQQVTVKAARTLVHRLVDRFGVPVSTPFDDLTRTFPDAATLAAATAESIGTLGIVRQRVGALIALAQAVDQGHIELHRGAPLLATMDALRALPGIGEWTTQVIAMRALAWPDAWPASDIGLMNALGTRNVREIEARAEAWRPWRAYAVMRLWHTLETGT